MPGVVAVEVSCKAAGRERPIDVEARNVIAPTVWFPMQNHAFVARSDDQPGRHIVGRPHTRRRRISAHVQHKTISRIRKSEDAAAERRQIPIRRAVGEDE